MTVVYKMCAWKCNSMHGTSLSCESLSIREWNSRYFERLYFLVIIPISIFNTSAWTYNELLFSLWTFPMHAVMPLVTFVKWDQGSCVAPTGEVGNCLPASDCQIRGGIAGGQCAGGV